MKINFDPKTKYQRIAHKIILQIVENFSQTFYVGGMVRDLILKKDYTDIDIATEATPNEVVQILADLNILFDQTHKQFGVILVPCGKAQIEITTLRTEQYTGSRFPKVKFTQDLLKDAQRRDFTINSLYLKAKNREVLDPVSGLKDIEQRLIRFIGDPVIKIKEDPIRILRAFGLQKKTGFMIEPKSLAAINSHLKLLENISSTRINRELQKQNLKQKN